MSIYQLLAGVLMFFSWKLFYKLVGDGRTFFMAIMLAAIVINAVSCGIELINSIASLATVAALSYLVYDVLLHRKYIFDLKGKPFLHRGARYIIISAAGLMGMIVVHNSRDISYLLDSSVRETVSALNPWGLFFILLVIVSVFLRSGCSAVRDITGRIYFRAAITGSSLILALILLLVYYDIVPGNTDKIKVGLGGVGFTGTSTNETGLLACCLLLWVVTIQHSRGISVLTLLSTVSSVGIVLLTQSRIGIVSMFLIFVSYMFFNMKRRRKEIMVAGILIALLAIPALSVIADRTAQDVGVDFSIQDGNIGGSGRGIIWLSYLDAFLDEADERPLSWLVGVGPAGVAELYGNTLLDVIIPAGALINFYPVHSDVVFTFLSTGIMGLSLWFSMVILMVIRIRRDGVKYSNSAALALFVIYSLFDMLIFSPLEVWLLLQAMTNPMEAPEVMNGTFSLKDNMYEI